jgi:hypothetical protein
VGVDVSEGLSEAFPAASLEAVGRQKSFVFSVATAGEEREGQDGEREGEGERLWAAPTLLAPPTPPRPPSDSTSCAFGIGANDVANAFASSVGAKALTMPQALIVAAFCEFGGAVLLGAGVTDTIKGGIANPKVFANTPGAKREGKRVGEITMKASQHWIA